MDIKAPKSTRYRPNNPRSHNITQLTRSIIEIQLARRCSVTAESQYLSVAALSAYMNKTSLSLRTIEYEQHTAKKKVYLYNVTVHFPLFYFKPNSHSYTPLRVDQLILNVFCPVKMCRLYIIYGQQLALTQRLNNYTGNNFPIIFA